MLRYTAFQDVGLALNPIAVEGQMAGSVVQGIGWALMEGFDYDPDGRLRNASLLDYRMPTALDVPPIECVIIETPVPGVPYGVRGVGEVPIVPPARGHSQRHRPRHRRPHPPHAHDPRARAPRAPRLMLRPQHRSGAARKKCCRGRICLEHAATSALQS